MNSGYTTIEIDGQVIGIKFGMPAIRQLAEKEKATSFYQTTTDAEGNEIITYSETGIAHIIYAGYCNNCKRKDVLPTLEFETFYDFVEEALFSQKIDEIKIVIDCFKESMFINPIVTPTGEEPIKKKMLSGTKSNHSVTLKLDAALANTKT